MLEKMRKNLRTFSIFLWLVAFTFVGTIFLVWGRGSVLGLSPQEVARVGSESISWFEFQREFSSIANALRQELGEDFKKAFPERTIKEMALRNLIRRKLLVECAKREGITISDWRVAEEIKNMKVFQVNGTFSLQRYKEILAMNRLSPERFESAVREDLLIGKLLNLVRSSTVTPESEVKLFYKRIYGKRKFAYTILKTKDFESLVKVSEKEVKDYYEQNKELFVEKEEKGYKVIKIPKSRKDAKELAKKLYNLAKSGNIQELEKYSPEPYKGKIDKNFAFKQDEKNFYIVFLSKNKIFKPFEKVKKEIEKMLAKKKAFSLALEKAQKLLNSNEPLKKKTKLIDKEEFVSQFKPMSFSEVNNLFNLPVKEKFLVSLSEGVGIFQPLTPQIVENYDEKRLKEVKNLLNSVKADTNEQELLLVLSQKVRVKINKKLLGLEK